MMRPHATGKLLSSAWARDLAVACLALGIAGAGPLPAYAQVVGCGSIVGPDQTVVLDDDLQCTRATGGITVIGPATLDLGGHHVTCAPEAERPSGIVLVGKRAQLRNGSVVGCRAGVEVEGEGRHRIEQVIAVANVEAGFRVDSDAATLRGNTGGGTTNGIDFVVRSDGNLLVGNTTEVAGLPPAPIGFRIVGNRNRLRGNTSVDHRQLGFHADFASERTVLRGNTASGNGSAGIQVDGPRTALTGNTVLANGHEGIFVTAPGARLTRNVVRANGSSGIRIFADVGDEVITRNTALDNDRRGLGAWDLEDGTPGCSTNRWRANVFATANDPCVD